MNDIKKHVDTIAIITSIICCVLWMNGKFNELEKDITIIKTVLIMKGVMPAELAAAKHLDEKSCT